MSTSTKTSVSPEFCKQLFTRGTDFIGSEEVRTILGTDLKSVPPIPFDEKELARARELGQYLILESHVDRTGQPLTMRGLHDMFGNRIGAGKFLCNTDWYKEETFYGEPIVQAPTWKLTGREVIPGSLGQNYLDQTQTLADFLRGEVYRGQELPKVYNRAIEEFESRSRDLAHLMETDWKKAAEQLASLQINQLFRQTPGEILYCLALYQTVNREYLLPQTWTWTKSRSSDGLLVSVGSFDSGGAGVNVDSPRDRSDDLGVCFSRSGVPES